MRRPTISDIARECEVSATAVSFALNGKPGVSEGKRQEILAKAQELGWTPSAAARALVNRRVDAIGLIITAPFSQLSRDTFNLQLIAGIERSIAETPVALVLKMVESLDAELQAIRSWRGENRVDGVILVNPREEDPRPQLVKDLGLRTVFLGDLRDEPGTSSVFVDDAETMRLLLSEVAGLGYRSIGYLHSRTGLTYRHARQRLDALESFPDIQVSARAVGEDDGADPVARVTEQVDELLMREHPDLLLCEDEAITLATFSRLAHHGVRVPEDIGVISWEGTSGLAAHRPAVTFLDRDPMVLGAAAVEMLAELDAKGGPVRRVIDPPRLVLRDSLSLRTRPPAAAGRESSRR